MSAGGDILDALRCGRDRCPCRTGKLTHCPAHDDANPSFSVNEQGGKVLMKCHTGCSQQDLLVALKARGLWREAGQPEPTPIRAARGGLVKSYEFRNAAGELVAEHGRFEQGGQKSFAWRRPSLEWRDGLGTVSLHDLPLYRLADVLTDQALPVWICEGEKATDACAAHGLLAVCLGGGAAQQSFGNTLDVLRDRDVILWPDNDEPGQALMARIHALLPQSRFVRPVLAQKADAYDYFAAGGTVEGLEELLTEPGPTVAVPSSDAVTVLIPVPAGNVEFAFTELTAGRRATDSSLLITVEVPGKRRTPFNTRLNLESSSAREGLRRELEAVYGKNDLTWAALISEATGLAAQVWRGIDTSVDLHDVALPPERRWAVENFAPEGLVTIPFGMGGSGKSYLVADIGLCCLYGMPWMGRQTTPVEAILVIDYEDREDEWRRRVQQLCDGHGWPFPESGYRYISGNAIPIADQLARLRTLVTDWNIGLVIVDSAASACGDDMKEANSASRMVNALTVLGTTCLVLAHNTKAEDSGYPYGSIFFHNLARATHYIEATQEEGSNVVELVIWNRKANRGKQKPIPARITFPIDDDLGAVTILPLASIPAPLQSEAQSSRVAIIAYLEESNRAAAPREIAAATGIPEGVIRVELSRNRDWFVNVSRGLWGLRELRAEEAF